MIHDALKSPEHADLLTLVQEMGSIRSVRKLSPLISALTTHITFRIDLADGRALKGHHLESAKAVADAVELGAFLPAPAFTRILGSRGRAMVSEWIDGRLLASRQVTSDDCRRAGAMLRSVHDTTLPDAIPESRGRYPSVSSWTTLSKRIETLCSHALITAVEGELLAALLREHAPPGDRKGLVHTDLCPENMIEDERRALHVVDNDSIDVHVPAFDLARTWLRWPMSATERTAFEQGYEHEASRGLASFRTHFPHWAAVVLIGSIEFRLQRQLPGIEPMVRQLRGLLSRGDSSPESATRP
jgi:thiamine kinase-like enzyme